MSATLEFITSTSGDTAMSSRSDVDDKVIQLLKERITLDGIKREIGEGWAVECRAAGDGGFAFTMFLHRDAMSRCFLCSKLGARSSAGTRRRRAMRGMGAAGAQQ
jgi:hypothetical protein